MLTHVTAVEHLGPAPQGSKTPHFFRCEDAHGHSGEYLVKQLGMEPMVREVFGNCLAAEFGLKTPSPVVVVLTDEAVEGALAWFDDRGQFCPFSLGLAAGCERVVIERSFRPTPPIDSIHLPEVTRMWTLDLFVQYADRTPDNPNCAIVDGRLFVYDFEQIYAAEGRFVEGSDDELPTLAVLASVHCCTQFMHGRRTELAGLAGDFRFLQSHDWSSVIRSLPAEWQSEAEALVARLRAQDVDEFMEALTRVL